MRRILCCMVLAGACSDDTDPLASVTSPPASSASAPGEVTGGGASTDAATTTTTSGTTPDDATTTADGSGSSTDGLMCLPATAACDDTAQCCGDLECGTTTLGQVCCGLAGASCSTPNGEDCCGDLLCEGGKCGLSCLAATAPCEDTSQCCGDLECGDTSLGQVCCGLEGESCATPNGEDCCGDLLCVGGQCGYDGGDPGCGPPCTAPPALTIEKQRLAGIGGSFLGICGDANHTYGYHVPAANLPDDDYSLEGAANVPVCQWHAAAIDIGMDWPASRDWLEWLIVQIQTDAITGVAEVIGSYDGVNVRYWSDSSGWSTDGVPYQGQGHDTWTHVAIHRSTALDDHGILAGWTADGGP
jgi:hypothetical protein